MRALREQPCRTSRSANLRARDAGPPQYLEEIVSSRPMSAPSRLPRLPLPGAGPGVSDLLRDKLRDKESDDLVFAVTGYIGSGTSLVAQALTEQAQGAGFEPHEIKLSDLLAAQAKFSRTGDRSVKETEKLQTLGGELRRQHGASIVAGLGVQRIREIREAPQNADPSVFIIDSLKHPSEVEILRTIYGQSFYLIGVVCNDDTRLDRLRTKYKKEKGQEGEANIRRLVETDRAEGTDHGQNARKTLHLADFFVANDIQSQKELGAALERFLLAVTGQQIVRPTKDEKGMHAAWSAALRSSCMSRQVGASIISRHGELLATGTNDPPSPLGGLYAEGSNPDHRCFKWPSDKPYCRNDRKKKEIYDEIHAKLEGVLTRGTSADTLKGLLRSTRIRDLIEFSRAIHAEMDALIAIAREGTHNTKDASLYCTTYPCHSCARHIVAAGIREVVYIEPYDKSLAIELHEDAIREVSVVSVVSEDLPARDNPDPRVVFRLFGGVAPRRFATLFEKRRELKDSTSGELLSPGGRAAHTDPILTGSFLDLEQDVAENVIGALGGGLSHD
jgi:deoxycytidylate deaminase